MNRLHSVLSFVNCHSCQVLVHHTKILWICLSSYFLYIGASTQNICGTEWPFMCRCAVKKPLTHSHPFIFMQVFPDE